MAHQVAITNELTRHARYLQFQLRHGNDPRSVLKELAHAPPPDSVVGLGQVLVSFLGARIVGLREIAASSAHGVNVPSTPTALWVWLRGEDLGELALESARVVERLSDAFEVSDRTDGFMFREGRDLSGYVDGTENPTDEAALAAGIVHGQGAGLDGGSFVSVQRWHHDLAHFQSLQEHARDAIIGRRISDNEEMDDAPESAHVKRAAQESFDPEAFVLRRSMPWSDARGDGLMFVAFGKSLDAFDALLARMTGNQDGITDGLFQFTRPITGATFWCPPATSGASKTLDLSALGL